VTAWVVTKLETEVAVAFDESDTFEMEVAVQLDVD
jgi:hypothetical protein